MAKKATIGNCLNSALLKGMLSAITVPGIPWHASVAFSAYNVAAAVLDET